MIYYRLRGHELQNDVIRWYRCFTPIYIIIGQTKSLAEETTVESSVEKGIASGNTLSARSAGFRMVRALSMEPLTEKEKKTSGEADHFRSVKQRKGMYPRWGLLTGVRPRKSLIPFFLKAKVMKNVCVI